MVTDFFVMPFILMVVLSNKGVWEKQINNYLYRSKKSKGFEKKD
jgi:hypothetical protein